MARDCLANQSKGGAWIGNEAQWQSEAWKGQGKVQQRSAKAEQSRDAWSNEWRRRGYDWQGLITAIS